MKIPTVALAFAVSFLALVVTAVSALLLAYVGAGVFKAVTADDYVICPAEDSINATGFDRPDGTHGVRVDCSDIP